MIDTELIAALVEHFENGGRVCIERGSKVYPNGKTPITLSTFCPFQSGKLEQIVDECEQADNKNNYLGFNPKTEFWKRPPLERGAFEARLIRALKDLLEATK